MHQSGHLSALLLCISIFALCLACIESVLPPCIKSVSECGKPAAAYEARSSRVVGGQRAPRGSWPWFVLLTLEGKPECGGAVLNERFILSSAHCFLDHPNIENWRVIAGKTTSMRSEIGERTVKLKKIIPHEDFKNNYLSWMIKDDISLLLLAEPLQFSDWIKPICLPDVSDVPMPGELCYFAGWGDTNSRAPLVNRRTLNQVMLPVISDDKCSQTNWYGTDFLPDTQLCAGFPEGGKDSCKGDSGGPLVCKTGGKWVVKGIASWGYGCGIQRFPGIYTDVTKYLTWIDNTMASNYPCVDDIN